MWSLKKEKNANLKLLARLKRRKIEKKREYKYKAQKTKRTRRVWGIGQG
jgi:hypothetical protein